MQVDGPLEWAETSIPAGNKLDLLQHAYNARLGVAALPKDATVALVQFTSDSEAALDLGDEVAETAKDEVVLHADANSADTKPDAFRYVAWSNGAPFTEAAKRIAHVAIATVGRVEVWRISVTDSVRATLVGSYSKNRIRGITWHPRAETLVVYNDVDVDLIKITTDGRMETHLLDVQQESFAREKAKHCTWSPCGLVLARSAERSVDFYSWATDEERTKQLAPRVSSYRLGAPSAAVLLGNDSKVGSISCVKLLSPSVCVMVTDTPLVLADMRHSNPSPNDALSGPDSSDGSTANVAPSSNIIDLTSLRITATSKASLLNILDPPRIDPAQHAGPGSKRSSHLFVVAKNPAGEWKQCSEVALDQFAIPDVLDVETMRVIIGSSISNRIVAVHLDHNLKSGWSASISGDIELPEGHVCRGVRLAKTSPFVQIASTEKIKRTFFHAASGPQRIQLSKFKVPRRRREPTDRKLSPTVASSGTPESNDARPRAASHPDAMAALLSGVEALQTLMVTRFDQVERRLDDVTSRLARLEVLQKATGPSL